MVGRSLVFSLWLDIFATVATYAGEPVRTPVAPSSQEKEAAGAILPKVGESWFLGERNEKESKSGLVRFAKPPFFQSCGSSLQSTAVECNDVALSGMQSQQYTKDDLLPIMSGSLECGMDSTASLQIKEHKEAEDICFRLHGRTGQQRVRSMGSVFRQTAMDPHNAGQQGSAQRGSRNFYGQAPWDASAASSATGALCRSTGGTYSRGGKDAAAFEGITVHGHGAHGVDGFKVGGAFHEGSESTLQSHIDPWAVEQIEQAQDAGGHSCEEDHGSRQGMDSFCPQYAGKDPAAWRDVPELSSRSDGALQCEDSRACQCETRNDFGVPVPSWTAVDGASHFRNARPRAAVRGVAQCLECRRSCGANRSHRSHGGGRVAGGRRRSNPWCAEQGCPESDAPFSWVKFAEQGCEPPPQDKGARFERCQRDQNQGEGQGRQMMDVTTDVGYCVEGQLVSPNHDSTVVDLFWNFVQKSWHAHFNQRYAWTSNMGDAGDSMNLWGEDGNEMKPAHVTYWSEAGKHASGGREEVHHCEHAYNVLHHQSRDKVEAKYEPLFDRDGSFDSLAFNMQSYLDVGSGPGSLDVARQVQCDERVKTILRGGREGNMDLSAPQVQNLSEFAFRDNNVSSQGASYPSWCHGHVKRPWDFVHSQRGGMKKKVTFSKDVELRLVFREQQCTAIMNELVAQDMWRHFWHMDGQIAEWQEFQTAFARMAAFNLISFWSGERMEPPQRVQVQHTQREPSEQEVVAEGWWTMIAQRFSPSDPRPEFIATWFLSPGRFHVCVRPRRIRVHRHMELHDFEHACRETWKELLDLSDLRFYVVEGKPEGLPSTRANIIIVQGDDDQWLTLLMKGMGLPPLMSVRAVLYVKDSTVRTVFQEAQYPEACGRQDFLCCIQYDHQGETLQAVDGEMCRIPQAQYVIGNLCPCDQSEDNADSSPTSSIASTILPPEEEDMDSISLISVHMEEDRVWTWEQHHEITQVKEKERSKQLEQPPMAQDGKEGNLDLLWSWQAHCGDGILQNDQGGGEGNVDLTWPGTSGAMMGSADDEVSWMSGMPMNLQFERPDPYPWEIIDDPDLEQEEEEDVVDVAFAQGHQEQSQAFIDQALEGLDEGDQRWMAVTFGLGLVDLGRRDTEFNPWRLHELEDKIRELWEDHRRYGSITIYHVTPQPCEISGPNSLVVLVVIESPEDMNEDVRNVLVIQRGPRHLPLRPAPYGAKIFTDISTRDALVQLDMHKHCKPFKMRDCLIRLGYSVMLPDQRYDVHDGMLCTVRVEDTPELVTQAGNIIDRVEDFYLQVEEVQHMEGDIHQVICHVHGISPANRPLGWRQLILEGDDLLSFGLDYAIATDVAI